MSFDKYNMESEENCGKIFVRGEAERFVPYDAVKISVNFYKKSRNADEASRSVIKESEAFLKELKKRSVDISSIELEEELHGEETSRGDRDAVRSERKFTIKTAADIRIINAVIRMIIDNHWSTTVDTSYILTNEEEVRKELMQEAMRNSREKAEIIAAAAGMSVGGLDSVNTAGRKTVYYGIDADMFYSMDDDSGALLSEEIAIGEKKLSEEMEVVWLLEKSV